MHLPGSRFLCILLAASLLGNWVQWRSHNQRKASFGGGAQSPGIAESGRIGETAKHSGSDLTDAGVAARVRGRERNQWDEKELAKSAPADALERVQLNDEGNERERKIASIIGIWARTDPQEAANWLMNAGAVLRSDAVVQALLDEWVVSQPEDAAQWIDALPIAEKASAAELLAALWAERDAASATQWAVRSTAAGEAGAAFHIAFESWIETDPAAVRAKILGNFFEDPVMALEASRVYGSMIAEEDPEAAWSYVSAIKDPAVRLAAVVAVVESLAEIQPSKTALFVEQETNEHVRMEMTCALIAKWAYSAPDQAGKWLVTLNSGEAREAGLAVLAEQLETFDPKSAMEWALRIHQPQQRSKAAESAFARFAEIDPQAAKAWLQGNSHLPLELKSLESKLPDDE